MLSLGPGELTLVIIAAALVFLAGRLPALGDALGRRVRKRAPDPAAPAAKDEPPAK